MTAGYGRVLATLGVAAFVQHAPLTFALVAVPAALRAQGAALWQVGLFALVFLPVTLQFLWAPAVERWRARMAGGWPLWIAATTLGIAALAAVAAMLSLVPTHAAPLLLVLAGMSALAGTQKIAAGGYALDAMSGEERAYANAALGAGGALGTLAGTAGLTALLDRAGWSMTLGVAAAGVAVLAAIPWLAPRPSASGAGGPAPELGMLLRDRAIWRRLRTLPVLGAPVGLAYGMAQPRLVDAGLDLTQVGLANGLGQVFAFLAAAPLVTWAVRRHGAPAVVERVMLIGAVLFAVLGLMTAAGVGGIGVAVASLLAGLALLVAVALPTATALMARARSGQGASELSLELCCFGLAVLVAAGASGALAQGLGHGSVLLATAACCVPAIWGARRLG